MKTNKPLFFNLYSFKPPTHPLFILKMKYECFVLTSALSLGGSHSTLSFSPPFDVSRMIIWKPSVALLIVARKHKHHLEYDKFNALYYFCASCYKQIVIHLQLYTIVIYIYANVKWTYIIRVYWEAYHHQLEGYATFYKNIT